MKFGHSRRNFGQSAGQQINGTSLVPAFDDPEGSAGMKDAAYSQFAKPSRARPFVFWPTPQRNATEIMGYTVRVCASSQLAQGAGGGGASAVGRVAAPCVVRQRGQSVRSGPSTG